MASDKADIETSGDGAYTGRHHKKDADGPRPNESAEEVRGRAAKKKGPRKKLSKPKKIALIIGAVLLACVIAAAVYVIAFFARIDAAIRPTDDSSFDLASLTLTLTQPERPEEPYYVLVVGSDTRERGAAGRSDTLMLCRVDPVKPQVTILSIPRDTEIQLPNYGTQKINAAYAYEGASGAVKAVSSLCGVDIAHYVEIDFDGVIELVDKLGGVTVNVPVYVELDGVYIEPGEQLLDGRHALALSRCRSYPMGDFQRVINQRLLLQSVAKKVLSVGVLEMPDTIMGLADCISTDLNATAAVDMLMKLRGLQAEDMYMSTIPSYPNNHDGVSYVNIDVEAFNKMMQRVNAGLSPEDPNDPQGNVAMNNVVQGN